MGKQMSCVERRRDSPGRWWHRPVVRGVAAISLAALLFGAGGCARQEAIQAAGVADAPVVTVRTLSTPTHRHGGTVRLVGNEKPGPEVKAEEPKAEIKPRRRRARPRKPVQDDPQPAATAATGTPKTRAPENTGSDAATSQRPQVPAEHPKITPRAPDAPEHVIEPAPPSRPAESVPAPGPEPPANPEE